MEGNVSEFCCVSSHTEISSKCLFFFFKVYIANVIEESFFSAVYKPLLNF